MMSHDLYPTPVTNCHTLLDPSPLEHNILYTRYLTIQIRKISFKNQNESVYQQTRTNN